MKVLVQRVLDARCEVKDQAPVTIQAGLLLYVSFKHGDTLKEVTKMAGKVAKLRIFSDADDKMNFSVVDEGKAILAISQFTLEANTEKGHRPSFTNAMAPEDAQAMFEHFIHALASYVKTVKKGFFQEHMNIISNNDGPVTVLLESR